MIAYKYGKRLLIVKLHCRRFYMRLFLWEFIQLKANKVGKINIKPGVAMPSNNFYLALVEFN